MKIISINHRKNNKKEFLAEAKMYLQSHKNDFLWYEKHGTSADSVTDPEKWRRLASKRNINDMESTFLSFDFIEPETYKGQHEAYHALLLTCGGPHVELRFFKSEGASRAYRIEYYFGSGGESVRFDVTDQSWAKFLDYQYLSY